MLSVVLSQVIHFKTEESYKKKLRSILASTKKSGTFFLFVYLIIIIIEDYFEIKPF